MCRDGRPIGRRDAAGRGAMSGEKFPATANFSVVLQRRDGIDLGRPAGGDRAGEQGQGAESGHRTAGSALDHPRVGCDARDMSTASPAVRATMALMLLAAAAGCGGGGGIEHADDAERDLVAGRAAVSDRAGRGHAGTFHQSPEDRLERLPRQRHDSGRGRAVGGADLPGDPDGARTAATCGLTLVTQQVTMSDGALVFVADGGHGRSNEVPVWNPDRARRAGDGPARGRTARRRAGCSRRERDASAHAAPNSVNANPARSSTHCCRCTNPAGSTSGPRPVGLELVRALGPDCFALLEPEPESGLSRSGRPARPG